MEKFTVDLDKVLDEFEFNEEQAIRHALQHFKREDLPATKYQKPHFKPINIADADFSPCVETTMTYPTYHHNHSSNTLVPSLNSTLSSDLHLSDIIEPSSLNNCHGREKGTSLEDKDEADGKTLAKEDGMQEAIFSAVDSNEKIETSEVSKLEVDKKDNGENENANAFENGDTPEKEIELRALKDSLYGESCRLEEAEKEANVIECEGKISAEDVDVEAKSSEEVAAKERGTATQCNFDISKDDGGSKRAKYVESVKIEPRPEPAPRQVEPLDADLTVDESRKVSHEESIVELVEESIKQKTEIKPIQFESQVDITDEELAKYLEELEEEEEEEQKRRRQEAEAESKPSRPDSLALKAIRVEEAGSVGTPLAKEAKGTKEKEEKEGAGSEKKDPRNESREMEEEKEDVAVEEMEAADGLRRLVEDSGPTEPPLTIEERRLGKVCPFWFPDYFAASCMECESRFTMLKRRHHCRACGRILCSKCCGMRASLEYLQNQEQRVCETCFRTLAKVMMYELQNDPEGESSPKKRPNPNNPMEYCSTVPPPLQVSNTNGQPPPSVLVPVGVLKREGSSKVKEAPKQVMFSDGIRPGGDLTDLDGSGEHKNVFRKPLRTPKRAGTPPGNGALTPSLMLPPIDPENQSFIVEKSLPPICTVNKGETTYEENWSIPKVMEMLKDPSTPPLHFAINRNLIACVKIVKLDCCMKETCWVIVSKGMSCVGQDEIVVLLTLTGDDDEKIPKDVFLQFHYLYQEAAKGNTLNELGCWCVKETSFLDSRQHGGFLFIRPTFQCLNRIETPPPPFLVGILIHRSEIPWARVFPFRLILRLGAEFRYYPCPLLSVRFREPVYYEIGHTIINLLADFRNLSYTIPSVRGLRIHMEANQTSILIPRNRYDQVIRALNNSNDPVLALAGNFSPEADAHLVCMQSKGNEVTYSTHAININDKPRKVTGASFVVLNGALKTTSGVAAKSSIVEDGLMVQVPSETMTALRTKLRNMEDWSVRCGPIEGRNTEEVVKIIWAEDDKNFNVGVKSVIDSMALDGVPSIRVHSGKDYIGCTKFIRWTQVFIIKCEDGATSAKIGDPLEVNKLSEGIARATCIALTKFLELLAASGLTVLAVRTTIDQDNVGYEAGSNGEKLAPIYMNELDNELVPVLHKAASANDSVAVLELIFHIMNQ